MNRFQRKHYKAICREWHKACIVHRRLRTRTTREKCHLLFRRKVQIEKVYGLPPYEIDVWG